MHIKDFRVAVVCVANQNRSMEAHERLRSRGFNVSSYGVGANVRLPGPAADLPNVYAFGTPYVKMYEDLARQDMELYKNNGVLGILSRNAAIKPAPERFQDLPELDFDVIITFEQKVLEAVETELLARGTQRFKAVHVICIEVKDDPVAAIMGGVLSTQLCQMFLETEDLDSQMADILERFQVSTGKTLLHSVHFV